MGAMRRLFSVEGMDAARVDVNTDLPVVNIGIRSPWASTELAPIVWKDIFGLDAVDAPVTRGDALSIPAVARAVTLITSTLAGCPLVQYEGVAAGTLDSPPTEEQPAWLWSTAGPISPVYRMQFTIEDLVLGGWCLWDVERDTAGLVTAAKRRHPDQWQFGQTDDGGVVIQDQDGQDIQPARYVLIKGPHDGILLTGRRALRGALNVERAWQRWIRNPIPTTIIQQVDTTMRTADEVGAILKDFTLARQDPDGAVAYIPQEFKVEALGTVLGDLLAEARNASAVDIARLCGIPAVSIDAGPVQTSLTYANTETANGATLPIYGLSPYAQGVGAALSMDDVCEQGTRVALDMTQYLADAATISRTGTPTED